MPTIDDGHLDAYMFVGTATVIAYVCIISLDNPSVNIFSKNTIKGDSMNKLVRDRLKIKISTKVKGILNTLLICDL